MFAPHGEINLFLHRFLICRLQVFMQKLQFRKGQAARWWVREGGGFQMVVNIVQGKLFKAVK